MSVEHKHNGQYYSCEECKSFRAGLSYALCVIETPDDGEFCSSDVPSIAWWEGYIRGCKITILMDEL